MECNVLHLQRNKLTGYVRNPYQMEIGWECIQSWQDKQKASGTGHENSKYSLTMHKTKHFPFFLWRRVWQDLTCNGAYKASTQAERQAAQVWRRDTGMRRETRTPSSRDEAPGSTWETRPEKGLWLWQGLWKTSSSEKFGPRRGGAGRTARVQGRWRRMTQPPWLKAAGPGRRFLPQTPPLSPRARPPETPPPVGLPLLPSRCHSPASHRGLGRLPSQASPSSPGTGRSSRSTRQRSPRRAPHSRLLLGAAGASGGGGAAAAVGAVSNPTGRSSKMAAPGPRGARWGEEREWGARGRHGGGGEGGGGWEERWSRGRGGRGWCMLRPDALP